MANTINGDDGVISGSAGLKSAADATGILALQTNGTTRFQIGAAGQLGIGGATYGTSGQVLTSGGASAAPTWTTVSGSSQWTTSGSNIYYNTGNVTVGGTTPLGLFTLAGLVRPSGPVTYTSAASNTNAQSGLNWYQDNNANYEYYLDVFATATSEAPWGGSNIRFLTTLNGTATASERARITRTGNMLIGTTTNNASGGVLQISNGITFPATQSASSDANTLDDYEEGTWTPVDGSGAGLSFTGVSGTYTKVGRCVTALAEVTYPTTANTSNAIIAGLPFTAAASVGINGYIRYTGVSTSLVNYVSGGPSSAGVALFRPGVNTTNASMSAGAIFFAVIYYV